MLKQFIKKVLDSKLFSPSPRIIICVPCGSTQVERRAIRESALGAGASKVYLIEEPMAAAIGADLPISEATGSMVVDIGGGTTEVAVLSLGEIVAWQSIRVGGYELDDAIVRHLDSNERLLIGPETAESAKIACGSAWPLPEEVETDVAGRDRSTGLLRRTTISSSEVRAAIRQPIAAIVESVIRTLETTPPELAADISSNGIVLAGGGALLRGVDQLLRTETHLAVHIADSPLESVVNGAGATLEQDTASRPRPKRRSRRYRHRR